MSDPTRVPDMVLIWLHDNLKISYRNVERAYTDIARTLSSYNTLSPRTEIYTSENGSSSLLLVLKGTLPIRFRGTTYRFPVAIWVPYTYPNEPPMIFFIATRDFVVRPSQHISTEGRVYHPYLARWADPANTSNLLACLDILTQIFAREPPLVARQQLPQRPAKEPLDGHAGGPPSNSPHTHSLRDDGPASTLQSNGRDSQAPAPPPKTSEVRRVQSSPRHTEDPSARYAPVPPPVAVSGQAQRPDSYSSSAWQHESYNTDPVPRGQHIRAETGGSGPPLPPLPPQSPFHAHRSPLTPFSPQSLQSQRRQALSPSVSQSAHYLPAVNQDQSRHHSLSSISGQSGNAGNFPLSAQARYLHPRTIVQDILSSPLDIAHPLQAASASSIPAPPIPPNPEKDSLLRAISSSLESQLGQAIVQSNTAIAALEAQQKAMAQADHNMQREIYSLEQLNAQLTTNESILHESMREADRIVEHVGRREVPPVDDVLVASSVVGEQLYKLVADDRSITDAMFVLTRALDKGRIRGDVFVKQTRSLAREQFLQKALIKKIGDGMGLSTQ